MLAGDTLVEEVSMLLYRMAFSTLELLFQGKSCSAPAWSKPAGLGALREWLKLPKQLIG